jgi:hypothetical protein
MTLDEAAPNRRSVRASMYLGRLYTSNSRPRFGIPRPQSFVPNHGRRVSASRKRGDNHEAMDPRGGALSERGRTGGRIFGDGGGEFNANAASVRRRPRPR